MRFLYSLTFSATALFSLSACQQVLPSSQEKQPVQAENYHQEILVVESDPKLPVLELPIELSLDDVVDYRQDTQLYLEREWRLAPAEKSNLENYVCKSPHVLQEDLWQEISDKLYLTLANKGHFDDYMTYYLRHKSYLKRVTKRSEPYLYYINESIKARHMPGEIALLPIVESGFYPFAKSYVSAAGLWQFMPATGYMYGLRRGWWYDGRQDVIASTNAALTYLQKLYKQNNYDWLLALASYNAGYGNVLKAKRKYLKKHPKADKTKLTFWQIRKYLPTETKHYVPQLLAISYILKHKKTLNIETHTVKNEPYFKTIKLKKQVSLSKVAQKTKINPELLQILNPGYLKPATPPKGPFNILLPIEQAAAFEKDYEESPHTYKVNWAKHKIKSGESLSVIARKYKTSVKEIQKMNALKSHRIRAGKTLIIPVPETYIVTLDQSKKKKRYNGKKFIHRVQSGESLWSIARYYNVSTRTLCEWNKISIKDPLYKGQKLEIRSSKYGRKLTHVLKKGESLWTVAKKYKVTTKELSAWNGIRRSAILQPGQKIQVWVRS